MGLRRVVTVETLIFIFFVPENCTLNFWKSTFDKNASNQDDIFSNDEKVLYWGWLLF